MSATIEDDWIIKKQKDEPNWRPYCLMCSTMARMKKTDYGFQCRSCGNPIKKDMTHYHGPT